jgi:hypothetical protein
MLIEARQELEDEDAQVIDEAGQGVRTGPDFEPKEKKTAENNVSAPRRFSHLFQLCNYERGRA